MQSLRRHWLIATCVYLFFPVCLGYVSKAVSTRSLIDMLLSSLLTLGITYWCAYRKPGTRWLLFLLIWGPVSFAASIVELVRSSPSTGAILAWSFAHVLFTWWYVMNWKLRKLNLSDKRSEVVEISA